MRRLIRLFKHRWADDASRRLPAAALQRLQGLVATSESQHSGEIRICVEAGLPNSYLLRADSTADLLRQRALAQFGRLRVWDTAQNNGVLIYLCLAEHAIELVADRGIDQHVGAELWATMVKRLSTALAAGQFENGLSQSIQEVSAVLIQHYAVSVSERNPNELPDTVVLA